MTPTHEELREIVRRKYGEIATTREAGCCTPEPCCEEKALGAGYDMIGDEYAGVEGYVADADLGLGCGVPVEHAGLKDGHAVLDLGSGAGLDAFVARHEVGEAGAVIGVDMTAEMVAKARENAAALDFDNVEFRLGEIEHLPVESGSVDVVISNCVLNLVPDKQQAFREIFRVLRPGGHFCISDIVSSAQLPDWASEIADAYAGCVSGAIPRADYLEIVRDAGFENLQIVSERRIDVPAELLASRLSPARHKEAREKDLHVLSLTLKAGKPF
jgi:ubiquinone/menaquinone biosynthesis C-methylase UbiE